MFILILHFKLTISYDYLALLWRLIWSCSVKNCPEFMFQSKIIFNKNKTKTTTPTNRLQSIHTQPKNMSLITVSPTHLSQDVKDKFTFSLAKAGSITVLHYTHVIVYCIDQSQFCHTSYLISKLAI